MSTEGTVAEQVLEVARAAVAGAPNDQAREQAQAVVDRLSGPLRVAIAGRVKAGKSTLLNALVGERLAPTDAGECTKLVSRYRRGSGYQVSALLHDGRTQQLAFTRTGGSLDIITMEGDSNERIFNFRIEKSATPALNFLVLPNSGVNSSATGYQAAIPLTGPHALATNVWFHVAVTYNGNAGAGNNLALSWTRLDAGTTAANLIGSSSLPADFTLTNGDFALGNDARAGNGENEVFPGLLDEVRISRVGPKITQAYQSYERKSEKPY